MSIKNIAKFATQMVASIYINKFTTKLVGEAFDQVFGSNGKGKK